MTPFNLKTITLNDLRGRVNNTTRPEDRDQLVADWIVANFLYPKRVSFKVANTLATAGCNIDPHEVERLVLPFTDNLIEEDGYLS